MICNTFQSCPDVSFLLRVLNLGVSAWEMISNQHFTEVALVSLSYHFVVCLYKQIVIACIIQ